MKYKYYCTFHKLLPSRIIASNDNKTGMTTFAYFIFKYKRKYYVFYNYHNGYPEGPYGLCFRIIENLKIFTREKLVQMLEEMLFNIDQKEQMEPEEGDEEGDLIAQVNEDFVSIEYTLTHPYRPNGVAEFIVKREEPDFYGYRTNDMFYSDADYLYIINVDQDLFVIKRREVEVQYSLFSIPEDWCDFYIRVLESKYHEN